MQIAVEVRSAPYVVRPRLPGRQLPYNLGTTTAQFRIAGLTLVDWRNNLIHGAREDTKHVPKKLRLVVL